MTLVFDREPTQLSMPVKHKGAVVHVPCYLDYENSRTGKTPCDQPGVLFLETFDGWEAHETGGDR